MKRRLIAAAVVLALGGVLAVGPAATATAADIPGPIGNAYDLMNYPLSVRGSELFAGQTEAAKAAWTPQLARTAASQAGGYAASGVYGNLSFGPATPGYKSGVVPIDVGKEFAPPRRPAFAASKFLRSPIGGIVGSAVAVTAFDMRGDIASGALSWVGIDANGTVCGDPVFGGSSPLNWLTGQDCSQWGKPSGYVANDGYQPHPDGFASVTDSAQAAPGNQTCIFGAVSISGPDASVSCTVTEFLAGYSYQFRLSYVCADSSGNLFSAVTSVVSFSGVGSTGVFSMPCSTGRVLSYAGTGVGVDPAGGWTGLMQMPPDSGHSTGPWVATGGTNRSFMLYFAPGNPHFQPGLGTDPDYSIQCVLTMTDSSTVSGSTASFKDGSGAWPAPVCGTVPAGKVVAHKKVTLVGGGEVRTLQDDDTTDAYRAAATADPSLCTGVGKACILDLIDLGTGVSCFQEADTCNGWMKDPNRDTKYACYYGGQTTVVNDCYVYATTFDSAKRLAGDAYADPLTGDDVGAAGPTSKSADEQLMAKGVGGALDFSWTSCFGGTYSAFNPIEWVLKPIQCSLKWAFAPREAVVQASVQSVNHAWDSSVFGSVGAVTAQFSNVPIFTGCDGMPVDAVIEWPVHWEIHWRFGAACSGPLATTAAVVQVVLGFGFLLGGVLAITSFFGVSIGFRGFGRSSGDS